MAKPDEVEITNISKNEFHIVVYNTPSTVDARVVPEDNTSCTQQSDDFIDQCELNTPNNTVDSEVDENFQKFHKSCYTAPKRRTFDPRFISEIETSDLATPGQARKILNFVRDTNKRKSKLIKTLRTQNWRLEKRISSLKKIISRLVNKNTVCNEN